MTAITTKSGQMRLFRCALTLPKWGKNRETLNKSLAATPKTPPLGTTKPSRLKTPAKSASLNQTQSYLGNSG